MFVSHEVLICTYVGMTQEVSTSCFFNYCKFVAQWRQAARDCEKYSAIVLFLTETLLAWGSCGIVSAPYAIWSRLVVRSNPSRIYLPT
jgi:hypothetical protein